MNIFVGLLQHLIFFIIFALIRIAINTVVLNKLFDVTRPKTAKFVRERTTVRHIYWELLSLRY